jgi:hypothetical protein
MFQDEHVNTNLKTLGWNSHPGNKIQGQVIVQFSDGEITGGMTYSEPYDLDAVKSLVKELEEARAPGYPTRDRCALGYYQILPATPGILAKFSDE